MDSEIFEQQEASISVDDLMLRVADYATRLGLPPGRYTFKIEKNNLRKRLALFILGCLEDRYENFGEWWGARAQMKRLFTMSRKILDAFPERNSLSNSVLDGARNDAWDRYSRWFFGDRKADGVESERSRIQMLESHAQEAGCRSDDLLMTYREMRRAFRLGRSINENRLGLDETSIRYIEGIARRSLATSWSRS